MSKRNKPKPPESFENKGISQRFTRIFDGMLQDDAFTSLNPRQRTLYLYMKSQYKGSASKDNPKEFCFNWGLASKSFKLYGNRETFYKDIKVLIDTGFIDCVENNRNLRQKNIYRFSDRWKNQ